MKARIARFYGWRDEEIESLDVHTFNEYFKCISALENHEQILSIDAASFPQMDKTNRSRRFTEIKKAAYNIIEEEQRHFSTDDIAKELTRKFMGGN